MQSSILCAVCSFSLGIPSCRCFNVYLEDLNLGIERDNWKRWESWKFQSLDFWISTVQPLFPFLRKLEMECGFLDL